MLYYDTADCSRFYLDYESFLEFLSRLRCMDTCLISHRQMKQNLYTTGQTRIRVDQSWHELSSTLILRLNQLARQLHRLTSGTVERTVHVVQTQTTRGYCRISGSSDITRANLLLNPRLRIEILLKIDAYEAGVQLLILIEHS